MLLICFNIGHDKYVLNARDILEITPLVSLKELPGSQDGVAGLLSYHGNFIPIIDISLLCGKPEQKNTLTTRLIIVNYHTNHLLGIKAENVTETLRIDEDDFKESGIQVSEESFLGDVADHKDGPLQLVNIDQLLSNSIKNALFPTASCQEGQA